MEVTEQQLRDAISAWRKDNGGKMPSSKQVQEIYNSIISDAQTETSAEKKIRLAREEQPLTEASLSAIITKTINPVGAPAATEMQKIPRSVSGGYSSTIDPTTGKQYTDLATDRVGGKFYSTYYGMNLVDENGKISNQQITNNDGGAEANVLFQKLNAEGKLPQFLQQLKDHNHYGKSSPSPQALAGQGMSNEDYAAIDSFVNSANLSRLTPMAYLNVMRTLPAVASPGSGSSIAFPNQLDVNRTVRDEFFAAVGRPPTPAEIRMAAGYIKQQYISAGGSGGEQAPSLSSAGQMAVANQTGEEGAVYSLGMALDRMFKTKGSI
jgi:hypothetical protein